jgi:hypothetical protein
MTLLPADDFGIRGHPGKEYAVYRYCAAPGCDERSVHAHHLWPRSFLRGQPYSWVQLPDGTVIGNRIGLCLRHHEMVTGEIGGYRARIAFSGGVFWWEERVTVRSYDHASKDFVTTVDDWRRVGLLDPQPPGLIEEPKPEPEVCPTCGHSKRKRTDPVEPPRAKKTWTVLVPDDAENGAEVLDTLVDDLAVPLGMSDYQTRLRRYFVLAWVLAWTSQHRQELTHDLGDGRRQHARAESGASEDRSRGGRGS